MKCAAEKRETRDRERLRQMLVAAGRPPRLRNPAIICYDAAWAGLPRITVYDPPKRQTPRRSYIGSRNSARPNRSSEGGRRPDSVAAYALPSRQLELPL